MKIDSHQHFWHYDAQEYDWIDDNMSAIRQDFLPKDLAKRLQENDMQACIAVQARQSLIETDWLLQLADENDFIQGIVGWVDLQADDIQAQLAKLIDKPKLLGFRHVIQGEPDPMFMLSDNFIRGLKALSKTDFIYELLVTAEQLPQSIELVNRVPDLPIVIDHIAKPKIASGEAFAEWANAMKTLGLHNHIYCKVSGMVTEADWRNWTQADFKPYLDAVFEAFGPERVMFGSDWPVCLVASTYQSMKSIVESYVKQYYPAYFEQVFGLNAASFYRLNKR